MFGLLVVVGVVAVVVEDVLKVAVCVWLVSSGSGYGGNGGGCGEDCCIGPAVGSGA